MNASGKTITFAPVARGFPDQTKHLVDTSFSVERRGATAAPHTVVSFVMGFIARSLVPFKFIRKSPDFEAWASQFPFIVHI